MSGPSAEPEKCSATTPHAAHTYGGRPMLLCRGIQRPDCDGNLVRATGQCNSCLAYHDAAHSTPPAPAQTVHIGEVIKCPAKSVVEESCICKAGWGHRSFTEAAAPAVAPTPQPRKPNKDDCQMLDAIMKAAKQIHEEFDCLSDHVMTKRKIREQIAHIIWEHIDSRAGGAVAETPQPCEGCKFGLETNHNLGPDCKLAAPQPSDERAAFEEIARKRQPQLSLKRHKDGDYSAGITRHRFNWFKLGWQASMERKA